MSTRKKAETSSQTVLNATNGATNGITNGHVPVVEEFPLEPSEPLDSKFTYNARTDTESLTIRTNSEAELEELIGRWKFRIIPKAKPKMSDGDKCQECEGFMTTQKGHNRTTGKEYYYLSCSNYPTCSFTAYLAQTAQAAKA